MNTSPEWEEIIAEVVSAPGVVIVVGAADVGKTHFCTQLASAGFEAGISTAIVDADIGQSEIGAPGTIGMAMVDRPIEALSDLKAKRLYFVGSTSPIGHRLQCVVGTKKMVDAALGLGAKLVIADTTGLVSGPIGRKLKTYKVDLVQPSYLIGIQKRREIEHLLAPFVKIASVNVRRVAASDQARRKPQEFRTARRQLNFYNCFHQAAEHVIHLDQVSCWNTWFGTGRTMKWQYMKFIQDALKCRVLHAEINGDGIFIISERACLPSGYRELEEEFKTTKITVVSADLFRNLLVGLADENGHTINVGLVQAIDFKQRLISLISPIKTISGVHVIQFGSMQVTRDGKEIGKVRQGEM